MTHKPHELTREDIEKVISTVDIPACPSIVAEAMTEAQKDEPDIDRLTQIITSDAGMSASAIKLANSALYSRGGPVPSLRKAIERLGTKNIVCVVIASELRASFKGVPDAWLEDFWRMAMQTAVISSAIAKKQYGVSPDAAFTYALFHDAAIPIMVKRFANYLDMVEQCRHSGEMLISAEENLFPCTHPIVGSLLVKNWGLPPILGLAIRFHHENDAYQLSDKILPGSALSFIAVTNIAERLRCEVKGDVDLEVGDELFRSAVEHLGLSSDDLDELRIMVDAIVRES